MYVRLKEEAKNLKNSNPGLFKLTALTPKKFSGEYRILFLYIAQHIIELINKNSGIENLIAENQETRKQIMLTLQELSENKVLFQCLLAIDQGKVDSKVDSELAKLYIVKIAYG